MGVLDLLTTTSFILGVEKKTVELSDAVGMSDNLAADFFTQDKAVQDSIGISDSLSLLIDPSGFPSEFSLTRPLLTDNPGLLVTGEDWQNMTSTQDVLDVAGGGFGGRFFFHTSGADPADTGYVTLTTTDPTFGRVVKCLQGDNSDSLHPQTTSGKRSFTGISRAWYRFTAKWQSGFTLEGQPGATPAWKFMFGGTQRHIVWTFGDNYNYVEHFNDYGGSSSFLPGSATKMFNAQVSLGNTEMVDEEWWEFIVYEERVSSTHYRNRVWRRELTANDVITGPSSSAVWDDPGGEFGEETTNGTVPAGESSNIQLGINRNVSMFLGTSQHWFWGPWEVLDGSVVADPYGIASRML